MNRENLLFILISILMGILFGGLLWWTLGAGKIYIGISFILGVVNLMGSLGTDWAYGKALDIALVIEFAHSTRRMVKRLVMLKHIMLGYKNNLNWRQMVFAPRKAFSDDTRIQHGAVKTCPFATCATGLALDFNVIFSTSAVCNENVKTDATAIKVRNVTLGRKLLNLDGAVSYDYPQKNSIPAIFPSM